MKSQRLRDLALAHLSDGKTRTEAARFTKISRRTMHRWLRQGKQLNRQETCRPSRRKLTPNQEREILNMMDSRPGLTLALIAEYALEKFGIAVSERTVSNLMTSNTIIRKDGTRVNINFKHELGILGMTYLQDVRQK